MTHGKPGMMTPKHSESPVALPTRETPVPPSDLSITTGLSELSALASQAFEEKRRKNCLALTRAILKIDPENKEAQVLQNWVQTDLKHNFDTASAVLQDASVRNNPRMYERAEMMLRAIVDVDPDHESAKALLSDINSQRSVDTSSEPPLAAVPAPMEAQPVALEPPAVLPPSTIESREQRIRSESLGRFRRFENAYGFPSKGWIAVGGIVIMVLAWQFMRQPESSGNTATGSVTASAMGTLEITADEGVQVLVNDQYRGTAPMQPLTLPPGEYRIQYQLGGQDLGQEVVAVSAGTTVQNSVHQLLGRFMLIVVPSVGTELSVDNSPPQPAPPYLDVKPGEHRLRFTAQGYQPETLSASVAAGGRNVLTVVLKPNAAGVVPSRVPPLTTDSTGPAASANSGESAPPDSAIASSPAQGAEPITPVTGILAVNSPVPAEIYSGERHLGSTPATLELPPGTHSLEYRFGNLRKTITHTVRGGDTTTATVTFDITVQINARPWAQVSVEGTPPRALGQTPLSNIAVPVGSSLVFRNPNFPEKRHRVTAGDSAIQVSFP
jgi:hypothetical protein